MSVRSGHPRRPGVVLHALRQRPVAQMPDLERDVLPAGLEPFGAHLEEGPLPLGELGADQRLGPQVASGHGLAQPVHLFGGQFGHPDETQAQAGGDHQAGEGRDGETRYGAAHEARGYAIPSARGRLGQ